MKHFGVGTPVVGSNKTVGLVELTTPAGPAGASIKLTSSHPTILAPPAAIVLARGQSGQSFEIPTSSVTVPTTVTVTAVLGVETRVATVTVRPASLSILGCQPHSIPVGASTTCTVWLDGVATAPTVVALSSPEYGDQWTRTVTIPAGERKQHFSVWGQNTTPVFRTVRIQAAYASVTKSVPVTIGPSYLKGVSVRTYFSEDKNLIAVARVDLNAAARGAFKFRVRLDPPAAFVSDYSATELHIPAGHQWGEFLLRAVPVAHSTLVFLDVIDSYQGAHDVQTTKFMLPPAGLVALRYDPPCDQGGGWLTTTLCPEFPPAPTELTFQGIPPQGQSLKMALFLEGRAPSGGAPIALSYPSNVPDLLTGPSVFKIPGNQWKEDFKLIVHPCPYPHQECVSKIVATYRDKVVEFPVKVRR